MDTLLLSDRESPMSPVPNRPQQPPQAASIPSEPESPESPESPAAVDAPQLMRPIARPPAPPIPVAPPPPAPTPPPPAPVAVVVEPEPEPENNRQRPIPAPSEPTQYRAIGLVRGVYHPSDDQFTRGNMVAADGTEVEAVLLGRVMSLVKNHLPLDKEHLWVVYPRTREREQTLHLQVVGVWEPENLNQDEADEAEYQPSSEVEDNYFSIRGEVVFYSPEDKKAIVKIQQTLRKKGESGQQKAFKLNLEGELNSHKCLGYFWDFQVSRADQALVIQQGTPIAMVPPRKKSAEERSGGGGRRPGGFRRAAPGGGGGKPSFRPPAGKPVGPPQKREGTNPAPKPIKRSDKAAPSESKPEG